MCKYIPESDKVWSGANVIITETISPAVRHGCTPVLTFTAKLCFVAEGKNNGSSKRYSRKREPSFPKSDTFPGPRRTSSQKSKNFDKRPPQRGGRQYGVAGGGRREEVMSDSAFKKKFSLHSEV